MGNRALRRCYCLAGSLTSAQQHRNCAGTPVVDRHNEHDLGVTFLQTTMNTSQEEDHLAFAGGGSPKKGRALIWLPLHRVFANHTCVRHCAMLKAGGSTSSLPHTYSELPRRHLSTSLSSMPVEFCSCTSKGALSCLRGSTFVGGLNKEARRKTERAIWGLPQKEHT